MQAAHLPTPFSAAEIRKACSTGALRVFEIKKGPTAATQQYLFGEGDGEGAVFEVLTFDAQGEEATRQAAPKTKWTDFQAHASYPQDTTTVRREQVEVAAGRFDCWVYKTTAEDGSWSESSFALTIPGPPVLSVHHGADSAEVSRMELARFKL